MRTTNLDVGDSVPEPIDAEITEVIERDLGADVDDDEPPPLPPAPAVRARGSQTYPVPEVRVLQRVITPRTSPVPPRRSQSRTPVDGEAVYQAVLRHFR